MQTLTELDRLLRRTTDAGALAPLTSELGFETPSRLDRDTRLHLGLPPSVVHAAVARGQGALRVLHVELDGHEPSLDATARIARHMARQAPEQLWFVAAVDPTRPRLVLAVPAPGSQEPVAALDVNPEAPHASDVETFAALAAARDELDLLAHLRWREILGRDALTRRFYRELAGSVASLADTAVGRADRAARHTIALLHTSRLLFLAFLEARGWLDGDADFLRRRFVERCGGRGAHHRFLAPLSFGTLNTPVVHRSKAARDFGRVPFLNGGLFARTAVERRHHDLEFTDEAIEGLLSGVLSRYRLSPREGQGHWSDASVDPEMLGRAFESLMHADEREARGTFYTPSALIARLTHDALGTLLEPAGVPPQVLAAAMNGERPNADATAMLQHLAQIRLLDPACGSGAFLVHALQVLATIRGACGDHRPVAVRRREVLTRQIFGVDVDPTAVWLCQLRLWLAVMVEHEDVRDPMMLPPLPNLDRNVREGDALAGDAFADLPMPEDSTLTRLRLRYVRANGAKKHLLARQLDQRERARAIATAERERIRLTGIRRELVIAARSPQLFGGTQGLGREQRVTLEAVRLAARRARHQVRALRDGAALPFTFAAHFAEAAAAGGFDLVLGNPPWVRPHAMSIEQRAHLREKFVVVRDAAWRAGAESAAAGAGFAAQADLAAVFTERGVHLTRRGGVIAIVLPAKLWLSLSGGGLRTFLAREAPPVALADLSTGPSGFDAVVYPSLLVARRAGPRVTAAPQIRIDVARGERTLAWDIAREALALDHTAGAPWLLLPPDVRRAFDLLVKRGVPLAASRLGRPLLGVKTGCNAAFLLEPDTPERRRMPDCVLRAVLRGEDLVPFGRSATAHTAICWTHGPDGAPLARLPLQVAQHLTPFRRQLEARADARGDRWWALFRTEAARDDVARVAWCDIGRAPRACVLEPGDPTVPLNTCYVVRAPSSDDAHALATLLNSPIAASWLSALAEQARGGYRRFMGWTCARFPLPHRWDETREMLAPIGRAAAAGNVADAHTLTEVTERAYGVRRGDLAPLLSWYAL